uniref:Nose resistant to fluoxetine protein 6 n=3 Tax=Lygus hesperus TaxID=30085 RepID=A0A0A9WNL8_LYGHE
MQLYVVCAICGYVMWAHKTTGLVLLYTLTVSSIIVPGIVVFQKNYNGVYLFYFDDFRTLFAMPEFVETYMYAHNRASPYIIGMLAGYFYYQIKSTKHNLSKFLIWAIFITAILVHLVTWLGAWVFYLPERPYYLIEHVSYAIFHRIGWSLAICVYIICDKLAYLGPLKQTISARIFRPLSTLSYAALLIHTPIQLLLAGLQRSPPYYNTVLLVWMSCGDIIFSYLAALLLHLFIEAPLARLKDLRMQHLFGIIMSSNKKLPNSKRSSE